MLAERLAAHFHAELVPEAGRAIIPDSNAATLEGLYEVADTHAEWIENALNAGKPVVIMDTDVNITESYARFLFGESLKLEKRIYELNQADLYLYCASDAAYIQDGTRLVQENRDLLDHSHRAILAEKGIVPAVLLGSWEDRWKVARKKIIEIFHP